MRTEVVLLEKTCPECGGHLVEREGKFGYFLGCERFPGCRHTEPAPPDELSEEQYEDYKKHPEKYDLKEYHPPSPYCKECNHTGLLPFVNKGGKTIPNAHLFCECHENNQPERFHRLRPSDIDYPVSYEHYRMLCQHHGWPDPGPDRPQEPEEQIPQIIEHIHRHSDMSRKEFDLLQQTILKVEHLESKLLEKKVDNKYTIK